jgi:hypothetical protein
VLVLRGFLGAEAAARLRAQVEASAFARFETEVVRAARARVGAGDPGDPRALLALEPLRALVAAALGAAPLSARLEVNAWRLRPGDAFGVHPDGPRYAATFVVGLCPGWTAAHGGALAFGEPDPEGLCVRERVLPHLGDLCLFLPHARSWHVVEPVRAGERLTLSGWWLG